MNLLWAPKVFDLGVLGRRRRIVTAALGLGPLAVAESLVARPFAPTAPGSGRVLQVGPSRTLRTPSQAAAQARDGDIVEIDTGDYVGDVAAWTQNNLVIRGVHGRPRILAGGRSAEGKGIFVVRSDNVLIENVELAGARVVERNGSGIRLERGSLVVRGSKFTGNECAILTSNETTVSLEIESCEFEGDDVADSAVRHVLYAGSIDRLVVRGSYFHRGRVGHLLKSRARENLITYNRITDEDGSASYEIDLPNGGNAIVLGNLIQQSQRTENGTIVSFGAEGYRWDRNELTLAHNTIVNDRREGGTFVAVWPGAARARLLNNLFVGSGGLDVRVSSSASGNASPRRSEFAAPDAFDYRIRLASNLVAAAGDPGVIDDMHLRPRRQYAHRASSIALARASALTPLNPGAFQHLSP
jgi:hypothetical protein